MNEPHGINIYDIINLVELVSHIMKKITNQISKTKGHIGKKNLKIKQKKY
jgi:hypothetical protein